MFQFFISVLLLLSCQGEKRKVVNEVTVPKTNFGTTVSQHKSPSNLKYH